MPNNREWALIVWGAVALCVILIKPDLRSGLRNVASSCLHPKVLLTLLITTCWVGVEVLIGRDVGAWTLSDTTDTVLWFLTVALVLFVNLPQAADKDHFFKRNLRSLVTIALVFGFIVNLFVFSLPVEIILLPIELLLVGVSVVASFDPDQTLAKKAADVMLTVLVLFLVVHGALRFVADWNTLRLAPEARAFLLPLWLTVALLPLIYIFGLYAAYELAFLKLDLRSLSDRGAGIGPKFALMVSFRLRAHDVARFDRDCRLSHEDTASFRAIREAVGTFRKTPLPARDDDGSDGDNQQASSNQSGEILRLGRLGVPGKASLEYMLTSAIKAERQDATPLGSRQNHQGQGQ